VFGEKIYFSPNTGMGLFHGKTLDIAREKNIYLKY
jgi:hypothetical protein